VAELARLREWLGTVEGFVKAIIALIGAFVALWAVISGGVEPIVEQLALPAAAAHVPPAVLFRSPFPGMAGLAPLRAA
jgi:hypothetical protein